MAELPGDPETPPISPPSTGGTQGSSSGKDKVYELTAGATTASLGAKLGVPMTPEMAKYSDKLWAKIGQGFSKLPTWAKWLVGGGLSGAITYMVFGGSST